MIFVTRLPVEEKPIAATWPARLRGPFPPACRGKGSLMDMACACDSLSPSACRGKGNHGNMACACDSLSPLPVEEKPIMETWHALAIPFSPCLSRKRQSWEHGVRLRFPFHPACRGKGNHGNMTCACDALSPLPVEEKAVMVTW